jgi:hypothetical protein
LGLRAAAEAARAEAAREALAGLEGCLQAARAQLVREAEQLARVQGARTALAAHNQRLQHELEVEGGDFRRMK